MYIDNQMSQIAHWVIIVVGCYRFCSTFVIFSSKMIEKIRNKPQLLFVIDGLGALLSAFLLGVVLVRFEGLLGIPTTTLYALAVLPIFFAIYDGYCYTNSKNNIGQSLKIIATMNVLYCCLSVACIFYHQETISIYAELYIFIEILIVLALAFVEYKLAQSLS